jgi:hypothetical protein
MISVPQKDLEALGFVRVYDDLYERPDEVILEDINEDGSVDLKILMDACCSMAALDAVDGFKKKIKRILERDTYAEDA